VSCTCRRHTLRKLRNRNILKRENLFRKLYVKRPPEDVQFKLENNDLKWIYLPQNSVREGNLVCTAVKLLVA
jgi:hypothetical protein